MWHCDSSAFMIAKYLYQSSLGTCSHGTDKSQRFHENIIFITRTIQDHPTRKLYHENIFFCCQIIFIWFVWFRLCMGSVLRFLISNAVLIGSWKERIFVSPLWYYRLHNKNNQLLSYKSGYYWPLSIYV